ncbi:DNA topoisomerase [Clostridia bacterium]|nr:DNA topoisomerase [Clostridia bacterium]
MSVFVIAEKPSVGMSLAAVLGATSKKNGYMEGNGYIVSWCIGHLAGLADAGAYGDFTKWRREDLPILPDEWQYTISEDKKQQFETLRGLMSRADVESLVCATDAGREGELIFRFVYQMAGCKKPFSRLWISSMEESAIQRGFAELKDGAAYDNLYHSALCRARADWLIGINMTRLFSTLYGKTLAVGRVQSPTLAMLTDRQQKISGFVKEKYHIVRLDMGGGVCALSAHIPGAEDAETIRAAADNQAAVCVSVKREQKTAAPPKLFDLTALQREANRLFAYTAKQTLDLAQTLYEKKLLTYPRTDSRYLTSDMAAGVPALVQTAAAFVGATTESVNAAQVINDAKVSDHHAIIPTAELGRADISKLPETERNILRLAAARLVCAVGERHVYETVTAAFDCGGCEPHTRYSFTAKGKTVISDGWKAVDTLFKNALKLKDESADNEDADSATLPPIAEGQTFTAAATVAEHFTKPPAPYTEDTLLSAMETAGVADTTEDAERRGLGTPATRAAVIENLVTRSFIIRKGKQLLPTRDGENLIKILPEALTSAKLTAEWENALTLIAKGEADADNFMRGIADMARAIVTDNAAPAEDFKGLFTADRPPREAIGTCPRCGAGVVESAKNFHCENRDCGFVMWKNDRFFESRKKELTKTIAAALLGGGKAKVKGLFSEKSGKTYDATILLADTGGKYVNYRFEPKA